MTMREKATRRDEKRKEVKRNEIFQKKVKGRDTEKEKILNR